MGVFDNFFNRKDKDKKEAREVQHRAKADSNTQFLQTPSSPSPHNGVNSYSASGRDKNQVSPSSSVKQVQQQAHDSKVSGVSAASSGSLFSSSAATSSNHHASPPTPTYLSQPPAVSSQRGTVLSVRHENVNNSTYTPQISPSVRSMSNSIHPSTPPVMAAAAPSYSSAFSSPPKPVVQQSVQQSSNSNAVQTLQQSIAGLDINNYDLQTLYKIAEEMSLLRGVHGVPIKDRKWRLRSYKQCFVASEAVDWLIQHNLSKDQRSAVILCDRMTKQHIITKVSGSADECFAYNGYFYRFEGEFKYNADEPIADSDIQRLNLKQLDVARLVEEMIQSMQQDKSDKNGNKQKLTKRRSMTAQDELPTSALFNPLAAKAQQQQLINRSISGTATPPTDQPPTKPSTPTATKLNPALLRDDTVAVTTQSAEEKEQEEQLKMRRSEGGFTGSELCRHLRKVGVAKSTRDCLIIGQYLLKQRAISYMGYEEATAREVIQRQVAERMKLKAGDKPKTQVLQVDDNFTNTYNQSQSQSTSRRSTFSNGSPNNSYLPIQNTSAMFGTAHNPYDIGNGPQSAPDDVTWNGSANNSTSGIFSTNQQQTGGLVANLIQWPGVVRQGIAPPSGFRNADVWYQCPAIARQKLQQSALHSVSGFDANFRPSAASYPSQYPAYSAPQGDVITYDTAMSALTKHYQPSAAEPSYASNWEFVQSFGDDSSAYDFDDADDLVTAVQFNRTGEYLAIGDKAGRVSIVQEASPAAAAPTSAMATNQPLEYRFYSEFQSHDPEFDCLKSTEIEPKMNCIEWWPTGPSEAANLSLLTTNDKTIKLWKIGARTNPVARQQHKLAIQMERQQAEQAIEAGETVEDMPTADEDDIPITAVCKQTFRNAHGYNVHSLSANSDGQTFFSADDLRVNVWNVERDDECYTVVDLKPAEMSDIDELITVATYHPHDCHALLHGSSKGSVRIGDMRTRALVDKHSNTVLAFRNGPAASQMKKTYFSEITDSILDAKYSADGRHILTRDYMTLRLWDPRMSTQPLITTQVHPHLQSQFITLLDNESIFDQFQCDMSRDGLHFVTGSYSHCFTLHSVMADKTITIKARDDAREPCVVQEWHNNPTHFSHQPAPQQGASSTSSGAQADPRTKQYSQHAQQPESRAASPSVSINASTTGQGSNLVLHNSSNNTFSINSVNVGQNNGGINIINNTNGIINISINNTVANNTQLNAAIADSDGYSTPTKGTPMSARGSLTPQHSHTNSANGSNASFIVINPMSTGSSATPVAVTGAHLPGLVSRNSDDHLKSAPIVNEYLQPPTQPNIYNNGKGPNYRKKMLKVAWHPRINAVAVAGLYKLYMYAVK